MSRLLNNSKDMDYRQISHDFDYRPNNRSSAQSTPSTGQSTPSSGRLTPSSAQSTSSVAAAPTPATGHSGAPQDSTRLAKDNRRLRDERNRLRVENQSLRTDNRELSKKSKSKAEELEERVRNLNDEVVRHTLENQELGRKQSEFQKRFDSYKLQKNSDIQYIIKDFDGERQQKSLFEARLRVLEQEKKGWAERAANGGQDLLETLAENQALKQRERSLIAEKELLRQSSAKLVADCRKNKERADQLTERCSESDVKIAKLEVLATKLKTRLADKLAKETSKLKSSFNTQITALKKQNSYFQKSSELNKRKHLVTEYLFKKHENMYKRNVRQIHESVDTNSEQTLQDLKEEFINLVERKRKRLSVSNTKDMADVIRENWKNSETIYTNAEKINQKLDDGFVQCPECVRKFAGIPTLRQHLKVRHFIEDETDDSNTKIIDSIDLVDD